MPRLTAVVLLVPFLLGKGCSDSKDDPDLPDGTLPTTYTTSTSTGTTPTDTVTTEDIGCTMAWTQGGDGVVGDGVWTALLDGTLAAPVVTSTLDQPTVATPLEVYLDFIAYDATGASLSYWQMAEGYTWDGFPSEYAQMWRADVNGTNHAPVTSGLLQYVEPMHWSPDNSTIVFENRPFRYEDPYGTGEVSTSDQIFTVPAAGGAEQDLTQTSIIDRSYHHSPRWSPAGDRFAYGKDGEGIYLYTPGQGAQALGSGYLAEDRSQNLTWNRTGSTIIFAEAIPGMAGALSAIDVLTGTVTRIWAEGRHPVQSPFDDRIAFTAGDGTLWAIDPDGANPVQFEPVGDTVPRTLRWATADTLMACNGTGVVRLSTDGAGPTQVTSAGCDALDIAPSCY